MDVKISLNVELVGKDVDFFPTKRETEEMFKEHFTNEGFEVISLNVYEHSKVSIDTPIDSRPMDWIDSGF